MSTREDKRAARIRAKAKEVEAVGRQVTAFMNRLPSDSPLRGVAFELAAMTGDMQARAEAKADEIERSGAPHPGDRT
jgi:hypothetical protein